MGGLFYGGMFVLACLITWRWGEATDWFPPKSWEAWIGDALLGVFVGLGLVWLGRLGSRHTAWGRAMLASFVEVLGGLRRHEVLALAFLSGIAEEALFRGALQPLIGVWWASLLFGLVHTGPARYFVAWTLFAFGFSLLIGAITLWRGGILVAVVAHITVNGINLAWIAEQRVSKRRGLEE